MEFTHGKNKDVKYIMHTNGKVRILPYSVIVLHARVHVHLIH